MQLGSLTVVDDVSPADWIVDDLESWGPTHATVASFLPGGFACYLRLLHPTTSLQDLIGTPPQTLNGSPAHLARFGVNVDPCDGTMDVTTSSG